jgi:polar amino acid transport system substrate-binding protein
MSTSTPGTAVMAILDEPPFCWPTGGGTAAGCDVEVARIALRLAGVHTVHYQLVTFAELIPGVVDGRWDLTTGMFITRARRRSVNFTRPIWAVPDGLIVRSADAHRFTSYATVAADPGARLGVVVGQVQGESARRAGVPDGRLVLYPTQDDAVQAILRGEIDAAASTAIGNRALVARLADPRLTTVDPQAGTGALGAFALSLERVHFAAALDSALGAFLGSPEHHDLMASHGFTPAELAALASDPRTDTG